MKSLFFLIGLILVLGACTYQNSPKTIYIVRHAEKQLEGNVINHLPDAGRAVIVNPNRKYKLKQGDALFIIAEKEPEIL